MEREKQYIPCRGGDKTQYFEDVTPNAILLAPTMPQLDFYHMRCRSILDGIGRVLIIDNQINLMRPIWVLNFPTEASRISLRPQMTQNDVRNAGFVQVSYPWSPCGVSTACI